MSNVELPLVPSARSTSASSSRSSLQSTGSDHSVQSSKNRSRQRSHAETLSDNEEYGEEDDGQGEEEPQESSSGLWDEVESFLNKPSPSLSALAKASKKPASTSTQAKHILPNLKAETLRRNSQTDNQGGGGGRSTRPSRLVTGGAKVIDPKLLEEAFAFARKAQAQMMNDDDKDEDDLPVGGRVKAGRRPSGHAAEFSTQGQDFDFSSSSSSLLANNATRPTGGFSAANNSGENPRGPAPRAGKSREADKHKKKASSSGAYGGSVAVTNTRKKSEKRLKEAVAASSAQWNSTRATEEVGGDDGRKGKKTSMDPQTLQDLMSSLQNGTALEELRKELAASQQSLALSRQVLHEAAKTFFQPS